MGEDDEDEWDEDEGGWYQFDQRNSRGDFFKTSKRALDLSKW